MVVWLVRRPWRGSLGFKPAGEQCGNYWFFAKKKPIFFFSRLSLFRYLSACPAPPPSLPSRYVFRSPPQFCASQVSVGCQPTLFGFAPCQTTVGCQPTLFGFAPCQTTVGCQPTFSCFLPFSRAILALPVAILALPVAIRLSLVTPQVLCHPAHSRLPADSAEVGFEPLPLP